MQKLERIEAFLINLKEFQVENDTDVKKIFQKREGINAPEEKHCPIAEILIAMYGVC